MHLSHLRLRDFRNYGRLDTEFAPGFHLFLGENAQGKTNLLEVIYFLATLRSFRGVASAQLVRQGQTGFFIGGKVVHSGTREIKLYWSPRERKLALDSQPVRRMGDFLGVFRAVVFCSEDLQLVKGTSARRRRFLDLLLAHSNPGYWPLLQRYTRALRSRNALLKQRSCEPAALEAFTRELVASGTQILALRREILPEIAPLAASAYQTLSRGAEPLELHYRPAVQHDFLVELRHSAARERAVRTTIVGPHRDELHLALAGQPASQYGSEGQKRSIVIALKLAQAEHLTRLHGAPPVLLIDDIMGELDRHRRAAFLPLLERAHQERGQVFMTCTEENWPAELGARLQRWEVRAGKISRLPGD